MTSWWSWTCATTCAALYNSDPLSDLFCAAPKKSRAVPARRNTLRASSAFGVAEVKVFDVGRDNRLVAAAHVTVSYLEGTSFERKVR